MNVNAVHPCKLLGVCPYEGLMDDQSFIERIEVEFMNVMESGINFNSYCDVFTIVCPIHWFIGPSFEDGDVTKDELIGMFVELDEDFKEAI
jgi:hypothetical protein